MNATTPRTSAHTAKVGLVALVAAVLAAALLALPGLGQRAQAAEEPVNLARDATPTVSFTRFEASPSTVNNGEKVYAGTVEVGYWTNWNFTRTETHWLEYTWTQPVKVDRSVMSFWTDQATGQGTGVAVPDSWRIETYDDATQQWVPVVNPSGYPTTRGSDNVTTFDAVTTTRLRAVLNGSSGNGQWAATAVSEWEVYGALAPSDPNTVLEIDATHVRTTPGIAPTLPTTVRVVRLNGRTTDLPVTWETPATNALKDGADVPVQGAVQGVDRKAEATVHVRRAPSSTITYVDDASVITTAGRRPALPPTVTVSYDDDSMARVPVTWPTPAAGQYTREGSFELIGTVPGSDLRPTAYVTVLASDGTTDPSTPTEQPTPTTAPSATTPPATTQPTTAPASTPSVPAVKASATLTAKTKKSARAGQRVKVTVTVSTTAPSPTGTIVLTRKGKQVATATLTGGKAVLRFKARKTGTWKLVAAYSGSTLVDPATTTITVKVKPRS